MMQSIVVAVLFILLVACSTAVQAEQLDKSSKPGDESKLLTILRKSNEDRARRKKRQVCCGSLYGMFYLFKMDKI
jgi:hypothetical protein